MNILHPLSRAAKRREEERGKEGEEEEGKTRKSKVKRERKTRGRGGEKIKIGRRKGDRENWGKKDGKMRIVGERKVMRRAEESWGNEKH